MRHVPVHTQVDRPAHETSKGKKTKMNAVVDATHEQGSTLLRRGALLMTTGMLVALMTGCASSPASMPTTGPGMARASMPAPPSPDPRVGLSAGLMDAGEAIWNLRKLSSVAPPADFIGVTNSDLAFTGNYAIQGNYNGFMVWDISNPATPQLVTEYLCPASQSDVSVYRNLLFVSGEGLGGRVDCGVQGVPQAVSADRLRGIRIFDITDIRNPEYIHNVQTCRGSHTHTVLKDPQDDQNVYIYVSGSAPVRPADELPGCVAAPPGEDENSALFRIEVIRVPLANPQAAAIVSSPRIFENLVAPPRHGPAPADLAEMEEARARGAFIVEIMGEPMIFPDDVANQILGQIVQARGGTGNPTAADSAMLRERLPDMVAQMMGGGGDTEGPEPGPTQCHDITVYPDMGMAGGACEGYGLLLDISDPVNPMRTAAVSDSNFAYWHSATFNNDGTKVLFTDEWGGGGQPKCRPSDPMEWGANAIFSVNDGELEFESYHKLSAPQTPEENCVAHNGSMIPVPGRDIMVQAWYQGGISVFDWTDPDNIFEIAFHDRGPVNPDRMEMGGSWSVYWYNGAIVSSEIARGLDIFELVPSPYLTRNEIDAANTVVLEYKNPQGQPRYTWPASFALARAHLDQLERTGGLPAARIAAAREALTGAERASGQARAAALNTLAGELQNDAGRSTEGEKVRSLSDAVRGLAGM